MKIASLGAGRIGSTLGNKWLAAGHEIVFGVRDFSSDKTKKAVEEAGGKIKAVSIDEAIQFAQVILIAIKWDAVDDVLTSHGSRLAEKIILDATNNFAGPIINSIAKISKSAPQAMIYRAFNSLSWEVYAEPLHGKVQTDLFYCGPDKPERKSVEGLIQDIGLHPIWVGENDSAPLVDNLGSLWINMVSQRGLSRHISFKLLE